MSLAGTDGGERHGDVGGEWWESQAECPCGGDEGGGAPECAWEPGPHVEHAGEEGAGDEPADDGHCL